MCRRVCVDAAGLVRDEGERVLIIHSADVVVAWQVSYGRAVRPDTNGMNDGVLFLHVPYALLDGVASERLQGVASVRDEDDGFSFVGAGEQVCARD